MQAQLAGNDGPHGASETGWMCLPSASSSSLGKGTTSSQRPPTHDKVKPYVDRLRASKSSTLTIEPYDPDTKSYRPHRPINHSRLYRAVPINWPCLVRMGMHLPTAIKIMCKNGLGPFIHRNKYGPQVIRLSRTTAVKFGLGVTRQEALNQAYAYHNANCQLLRVPQVFSFFEGDERFLGTSDGYLVMEYVQGQPVYNLLPEIRKRTASRVALAMKHLNSFPLPRPCPGPIMRGGVPCGYIWSDDGACTSFHTLAGMLVWLNSQLTLTHPESAISIDATEMAFRHMDINPRNVLLSPDGQICFVDWQFAGVYPSIFELIHIKVCEWDDHYFFNALLTELPDVVQGLNDPRYPLLLQIKRNNIRFGTMALAPPPD